MYLTSWEAPSIKPNKEQPTLTLLYDRKPVWPCPPIFSPFCIVEEEAQRLPHHHAAFHTEPVCVHLKKRLLCRLVENGVNDLILLPKESHGFYHFLFFFP